MYGLPQDVTKMINAIKEKYNKEVKFKIFGSRARGDFRNNSDIDIAVIGKVNDKIKFEIKDAFDKLDIIYMIDLVFLDDIDKEKNKEFIKNILMEGIDM